MTINLVGPVTTTQVVTTAKKTLPVVRKTAETVVKTVKHLPKTGGAKKTLLAVVVAALTALGASCTGQKNKIDEPQVRYQYNDEMFRLDNESWRAHINHDEAALDSIKKLQADLKAKHKEYLEPFESQSEKIMAEMSAYDDSLRQTLYEYQEKDGKYAKMKNTLYEQLLSINDSQSEKIRAEMSAYDDSLRQTLYEYQEKNEKYAKAKNTLYEQLSSINDSIHARELSFEP